ncbi:MAG TPA: hypothetical protein VNH53_02405 [Sphingomicrobium sp.]|nr:hypothetical protein [Sphingomicrobium sp.]
MRNRTPVPRAERPPLPDFTPVPRKCARHDGWTPTRQRAFIAALADTGSVSRAAAMVNMAPEGAYQLRRHPEADGFRRAWEAALDCGVAKLKDIALERAIHGYLVPCFVGGKLIGWRRKHNDRLLMFCLRHYGEDAEGRRTTINYFSTRATAGSLPSPSGEGAGGGAAAEASTTTVRTVISGPSPFAPGESRGARLDGSAAIVESFDAVELDEQAQAAIHQALADCAARRRALAGTPGDPDEHFIAVEQPEREVLVYDPGYSRPRKELQRPPPAGDGPLVAEDELLEPSPRALAQPEDQYRSGPGEFDWQMLDDEEGMKAIEDAVESVKRAKLPSPSGEGRRGGGTEENEE